MNLGELRAQLDRASEETPGGEAVGDRRRVFLRGWNKDEFVWVEGELQSVEAHLASPDLALTCLVTEEQEAEVFRRVDEEGDIDLEDAVLLAPGTSIIEALDAARAAVVVEKVSADVDAPGVEFDDNFDPPKLASSVHVRTTRADILASVARFKQENGSAPTPAQLESPEFDAVWQVIKAWDIGVRGEYSGAMGNDVVAILKALAAAGSLTEWGGIKERWR